MMWQLALDAWAFKAEPVPEGPVRHTYHDTYEAPAYIPDSQPGVLTDRRTFPYWPVLLKKVASRSCRRIRSSSPS